MQAARNREFACALVWKFDRFARSTAHLLAALEEFKHLGIRFISVQDQIDTHSPMGRAMFTIIGAMAELGSSLIGERVTAGMRAAKARAAEGSGGSNSTPSLITSPTSCARWPCRGRSSIGRSRRCARSWSRSAQRWSPTPVPPSSRWPRSRCRATCSGVSWR